MNYVRMDSFRLDGKPSQGGAAGSRRTSFVVWAILVGGVCCFAWAATQAAQRIGASDAAGAAEVHPAAALPASAAP